MGCVVVGVVVIGGVESECTNIIVAEVVSKEYDNVWAAIPFPTLLGEAVGGGIFWQQLGEACAGGSCGRHLREAFGEAFEGGICGRHLGEAFGGGI